MACGALNVDGCRIEAGTEHYRPHQPTNHDRGVYASQSAFQLTNAEGCRWPSNVLIDDSPEVEQLFPHSTSGIRAEGVDPLSVTKALQPEMAGQHS